MNLYLLINQKTEQPEQNAFNRAVVSAADENEALNLLYRCLEGYSVFFTGAGTAKCVYKTCFSRDVDEEFVVVHEIGSCSIRASGVFAIS